MSGWTVVTLHGEDDEANATLEEQIQNAYGGEGRDPPTADGYGDRTIQELQGASHTALARKYGEQFPTAEYILVIAANDTTDSGRGTLFQRKESLEGTKTDGSTGETYSGYVQIDSKDGYEGARGNDVTGYFRDEYDVRGYATWEA